MQQSCITQGFRGYHFPNRNAARRYLCVCRFVDGTQKLQLFSFFFPQLYTGSYSVSYLCKLHLDGRPVLQLPASETSVKVLQMHKGRHGRYIYTRVIKLLHMGLMLL